MGFLGYVLVLVTLQNGELEAAGKAQLYKIDECFLERERLINTLDTWPLPNVQLLCLPVDANGIQTT